MSVLEQGRKYIIVRKVMNKRQTGIKRITKGIERDRNKKKKRKSEQANKQAREREGVRPGKRSKSKLKRQTIRKRQRPRRHNLQVKRTAYYRDFLFLWIVSFFRGFRYVIRVKWYFRKCIIIFFGFHMKCRTSKREREIKHVRETYFPRDTGIIIVALATWAEGRKRKKKEKSISSWAC